MRCFALVLPLIFSGACHAQLDEVLTGFSNKLPLVHETAFFQAGKINPAWKTARLYTPPAGEKPLLGQFKSGDELTLKITELPDHDRILICIEIVIFCHWDGIWKAYGPDTWKASIKNGPTLLETTFSNFSRAKQNFPDEIGLHTFPPQTGANSIGDLDFVEELGEHKAGWKDLDATYRIWLAASHSDPIATFAFCGNFHDNPDNINDWGDAGENWAVKSCRVWAVPAGINPQQKATELAIAEILTTADKTPDPAAVSTLVLSGRKAFEHLTTALQKANLANLTPAKKQKASPLAKRDGIIKALESEKFSEREKASQQLADLMPKHREYLENTAETHEDPEVSERIYQALDDFEKMQNPEESAELSLQHLVKPRLERIIRLLSAKERKQWNAGNP